jgi:hypothetical protein
MSSRDLRAWALAGFKLDAVAELAQVLEADIFLAWKASGQANGCAAWTALHGRLEGVRVLVTTLERLGQAAEPTKPGGTDGA